MPSVIRSEMVTSVCQLAVKKNARNGSCHFVSMQAREHNHDTYIALTKYINKTIRLFTTTSRNNPTGCSRFCVGVSFSPASIFLKRRGRRVRSDYQTISSKDFQGFTSIRRKSVRIGLYSSKYEIDDRFGLTLQFYYLAV